jgi:hypothetical protein
MNLYMNLKDNVDAAEALANWFESQDISPARSSSIMILLLAAAFVEAVKEDGLDGKLALRNQILTLFDVNVKALEHRK